MRFVRFLLALNIILPVLGNAAPSNADVDGGYIVHHSNMESRKDGNIRATIDYLFGRPVTQDEVDNRSEIEKILDARDFKTWFDFKNRTSQYFKRDLKVKPALVKHVNSPQEALLAKLMIARQAEYTLDATYYIFTDDDSGYALLNEFKEALRRGVSIRMMVDSLGSLNVTSPTHPALKALVDFANKHAGFMKDRFGRVTDQKARVEAVSFRSVNPSQISEGLTRKIFRLAINKAFEILGKKDRVETVYVNPNRRSHDKVLIADQNFPELAVAILGGRNISNHYYGIPQVDENTFADLEIIVKNDPEALARLGRDAITTNLADLYEQLYFHSGNRLIAAGFASKLLGFSSEYKKMEEASIKISDYTVNTQKQLGEDIYISTFGKKYLSEGFLKGEVDLAYTIDNVLRSSDRHSLDPALQTVEDKINVNNITFQFEKYIAAETEHIMVVSPYLWLSPDQIRKFKIWLGNDPKRKFTIITNSILTSDNPLAQTLVDGVLGPKFLLDRSYIDLDNKVREYQPNQIEIYEYGKLDAVELGGRKAYGKLHAKGVYLKATQTAAVTTWNGDPRSQYLNSETGLVVKNYQYAEQVRAQFEAWIKDSHVWGSEEFHAIRKHEKLGLVKRQFAERVNELYKVILKTGFIWLI